MVFVTLTTALAASLIALAGWRETRQLGDYLDDREIREAAPVVAGLIVIVAHAVAAAWTSVPIVVALSEAVRQSAAVMLYLVGLEGVLADQGVIRNEWLLLPGPLRAHAREKIGSRTGGVDA